MKQERQHVINKLLHDHAFHEQVRTAEIIISVDEATEACSIMFGVARLNRIIKTNQSERLEVLRVPILTETSELEALIAVVREIKGYDDYSPSQDVSVNTEAVAVFANPRSITAINKGRS